MPNQAEFIANSMKAVFSRLQDTQSRMIFQERLQYFLSGETCHLMNVLKISDMFETKWRTILDLIRDPLLSGRECILYGAGYYSRMAMEMLQGSTLKVIAYCDKSPSKRVKEGLPVLLPNQLSSHMDKIILISSVVYRDEIFDLLCDMGFPKEQVFSLGRFDEQYFGNDFLKPLPDEIYVDAGCYDGYTIKRFFKFCEGRYRKIYGFEPVAEHFGLTRKCVEDLSLDDVKIINKAVWSKDAVLRFALNGEGSNIANSGDSRIEATTVDEVVGDDAVTLIKMDVEGAELAALKGAAHTILRNKPRLAICVYHKPEDIVSIPVYIHSLVPEYKFYLRHHDCDQRYMETVLYAVI